MPMTQPIGQESQMPVVASAVCDSVSASTTRRTRSVNVATMKRPIMPAPRSTPSATSFAAMRK